MTLTLQTIRGLAALVALAAMTAGNAARANHFILPCGDDCTEADWVQTGSLNTAREYHTATRMSDGRVLVAGGIDANGEATSSAELYDPATGTWTVTGSMTVSRFVHVAFALPTGEVLVIGGDAPCCLPHFSAEIYNASTASWRPAGGQFPKFGLFAATMLSSGKVFLTGVGPDYYSTAWLYDSMQQTFTQAIGDPVYRQSPDAAVLPNGNVLIVGGTQDADEEVIAPGAEAYDLATGTWQATGPPSTLRQLGVTAALADGSVLIAGGLTSVTLRSSETYGADGAWHSAGDLNEARFDATSTLLGDGRVLVVGGETFAAQGSVTSLKSAELYDSRTAAWSYTSSLTVARSRHTATLLDDGSVLVVGGIGGDSSSGPAILGSAEIYRPAGASILEGSVAP